MVYAVENIIPVSSFNYTIFSVYAMVREKLGIK